MSITAATIAEMFAQSTATAMFALAKVSHDSFGQPIYFCNNNAQIDFGGNSYLPLNFKFTLADSSADTLGPAQIEIDNVDQQLISLIRSNADGIKLEVQIISINESGGLNLEIGPITYNVLSADYDVMSVRLTLGYEAEIITQSGTNDRFNPSTAPGLF